MNRIMIWRLLEIENNIYSIAKKSSSRHELKISRRSGIILPRIATIIAATLPAKNPILNPPYGAKATLTKKDSLMGIRI